MKQKAIEEKRWLKTADFSGKKRLWKKLWKVWITICRKELLEILCKYTAYKNKDCSGTKREEKTGSIRSFGKHEKRNYFEKRSKFLEKRKCMSKKTASLNE